MNYAEWFTALLRLPIRIYLQHYVELSLLLLVIIYYPALKQKKLQILLPLVLLGLILDVVFRSSALYRILTGQRLFEFMIIIFGVYLFERLKKARLLIFPLLMAIDSILSLVADFYASHGKHNLFIHNFYIFILAPLFFVFFYQVLRLRRQQKKAYLILAGLSVLFFCCDYLTHNEDKLNSTSIVLYYLEHLVLGCFVIAGLVTDQDSRYSLIREPGFWICTAIIIEAVVFVVFDGLHPYLVENYIQIYKSKILFLIKPITWLFCSICYFYAFFLCGMRYQD
jgi:hypothetical protein